MTLSMPGLLARWRSAEPVRLYLYGLLVPAAAVAVGYGAITGEQAALWVGLGTAALVGPAAEGARAQVTPVGIMPATPHPASDPDGPPEQPPAPRHRAS